MIGGKKFVWVPWVRRWVPAKVRYKLQEHISLSKLKLTWQQSLNPTSDIQHSDENRVGKAVRAGIIYNAAQYHSNFVAACLELGVPFKVLDLYRDNWLEIIQEARVDFLLFWPDAFLSIWGQMLKDRVWILERDLEYKVFPGSHETWMYEDKRRMTYWLKSHHIPHPRTWVYYRLKEALEFTRTCDLPIVFKTPFGASGSGVRIIRDRRALSAIINRVFRKGIVSSGGERRDRQWGSLVLQEHVSIAKEWRLVRIGDSCFGHPKGQRGEYHSGSGIVLWDVPEPRHLDFLWEVTKKGRFRSMAVDTFETPDGRMLVNELQAVFGASFSIDQLRVNGIAGRFVKRASNGNWIFEPGDFARNSCANLRLVDALKNFCGIQVNVF